MPQTRTTKTCQYKGRTYLLMWEGATKYGQRAKLAFMDGSKEFWVAAADISGTAQQSGGVGGSKQKGRGCPECGKNRRLIYDMEDGVMKCYECCDMPSD